MGIDSIWVPAAEHAKLIATSLSYKLLHSAEIGVAAGLFTKYVGISGVEKAFIKPALWLTGSVFLSSSLIYGIETYAPSQVSGAVAAESANKSTAPLLNAAAGGVIYGAACRFVSHKCGNMGAVKMAGVGAAAILAGELLAPVITQPIFARIGGKMA